MFQEKKKKKNLWLCNVLECKCMYCKLCSSYCTQHDKLNPSLKIHHWVFILLSKWRKCLSPAFIPEWLERWRNLGEVFQSNTVHIMLECLFFYCIGCIWCRLKGWGMLKGCNGTFPQARSFIKVIANWNMFWYVYMLCSFSYARYCNKCCRWELHFPWGNAVECTCACMVIVGRM